MARARRSRPPPVDIELGSRRAVVRRRGRRRERSTRSRGRGAQARPLVVRRARRRGTARRRARTVLGHREPPPEAARRPATDRPSSSTWRRLRPSVTTATPSAADATDHRRAPRYPLARRPAAPAPRARRRRDRRRCPRLRWRTAPLPPNDSGSGRGQAPAPARRRARRRIGGSRPVRRSGSLARDRAAGAPRPRRPSLDPYG